MPLIELDTNALPFVKPTVGRFSAIQRNSSKNDIADFINNWKRSEGVFLSRASVYPNSLTPRTCRLKSQAWVQLIQDMPKHGITLRKIVYPDFRGRGVKIEQKHVWPTPCARDWKDTGCPGELGRQKPRIGASLLGEYRSLYPDAPHVFLNSTWLEWLMGFPFLWSKANPDILMKLT